MCLKVYNYCPACMGPTCIYQYHACNKAGTCPGITKEKRPITPELVNGSYYHCLNYGCGMSENLMATHEERINTIIKNMNEETAVAPAHASAPVSSGPAPATPAPAPAPAPVAAPSPAPALASATAVTTAAVTTATVTTATATTSSLSPVGGGLAGSLGTAPTDQEIEELLAAPKGSPKKKRETKKSQKRETAGAGQGQIEAGQPPYAPVAAGSPSSISRPVKRASPGSGGRPAKRQQMEPAAEPAVPAVAAAPITAAPITAAPVAAGPEPASSDPAAPAPISGGEGAVTAQEGELFSEEELDEFFAGGDLLSSWARGDGDDSLFNSMMGFNVRAWGEGQ